MSPAATDHESTQRPSSPHTASRLPQPRSSTGPMGCTACPQQSAALYRPHSLCLGTKHSGGLTGMDRELTAPPSSPQPPGHPPIAPWCFQQARCGAAGALLDPILHKERVCIPTRALSHDKFAKPPVTTQHAPFSRVLAFLRSIIYNEGSETPPESGEAKAALTR